MGLFDFFKKGTKNSTEKNSKDEQRKDDLTTSEIEIIKKHNQFINQKIQMIHGTMPYSFREFPQKIKNNFEYKIRIKLLLSDLNRQLSAEQIKEADNILKNLNRDTFDHLLNELSVLKIINKSNDNQNKGTVYTDGPVGEFIELLLIEMYKVDVDEKIQKAGFYLNTLKDIEDTLRERILSKVRIMHAIEISHRPLSQKEISLFDKNLAELNAYEIETMLGELVKSKNIMKKQVGNETVYSFESGKDFIQNDIRVSKGNNDKVAAASENDFQGSSIVYEYKAEVGGFIENILGGLNNSNIVAPEKKNNVLLKARLIFLLKKFDRYLDVEEMQRVDRVLRKEGLDKITSLLEELKITKNIEIQNDRKYRYISYNNFYANDLNISKEANDKIQEIRKNTEEAEHYPVSENIEDRETHFEEDLVTLYYTRDNFKEIILRGVTSAYSILKVILGAEITLGFSMTDDDGNVTSSSDSSLSFLDGSGDYCEELWNKGFHILLSSKSVNLFKESPQSPLARLCGAYLFSNVLSLLEKDNEEGNQSTIEKYGRHFAYIVEACIKPGSQCGVEEYCLMTGMYLNYPDQVKRAVEKIIIKASGKKLSNLKLIMKELARGISLPFDIDDMTGDYIDDFLEQEGTGCETKEFNLHSNYSRVTEIEKAVPVKEKRKPEQTEKPARVKRPAKSISDFDDAKQYERYRLYGLVEDLLAVNGIQTLDGELFEFTEGSIVARLKDCDVQIKSITPRIGWDRYVELEGYVEKVEYIRKEKFKVDAVNNLMKILRDGLSNQYEICEGYLFGFTSTALLARSGHCDVQIKLIPPRDEVQRFEQLIEEDGETCKDDTGENIAADLGEEIVDFIPLSEIKREDFKEGGRISRGIIHYLKRNFEKYHDKVEEPAIRNEAYNELFLDLANLVDFNEYQETVAADSGVNGMVLKALFLQTINHFWYSHESEKPFDLEGHVNSYAAIFKAMIKFIFSKETELEEDELLLAFGSYGLSCERETFKKLIRDNKYSRTGRVLINKLQYIHHVVKASMNLGDMAKPIVNSRINALRYLYYLSEDALFYHDSQIVYDGNKHKFAGIEFNSERIWLYSDMLLDLDGFIDGMLELGQYVEQNDKLNVALENVVEDIHEIFMNEDITGISLINLFTSGSVRFKFIGNERYLIHLDDDIKEGFPGYEKYMTELISTLREYNGLSMKNVELVFDDVFDLPADIKEKYGIDKSTTVNTRFINSTLPRN